MLWVSLSTWLECYAVPDGKERKEDPDQPPPHRSLLRQYLEQQRELAAQQRDKSELKPSSNESAASPKTDEPSPLSSSESFVVVFLKRLESERRTYEEKCSGEFSFASAETKEALLILHDIAKPFISPRVYLFY